jgi:hypothetical protein
MSSHQEGIQTEVDDVLTSAQIQAQNEAREKLGNLGRPVLKKQGFSMNPVLELVLKHESWKQNRPGHRPRNWLTLRLKSGPRLKLWLLLRPSSCTCKELRLGSLPMTWETAAGTGNGGQGPRGDLGTGDQHTGDPNAQGGLNRGQENSQFRASGSGRRGQLNPPPGFGQGDGNHGQFNQGFAGGQHNQTFNQNRQNTGHGQQIRNK